MRNLADKTYSAYLDFINKSKVDDNAEVVVRTYFHKDSLGNVTEWCIIDGEKIIIEKDEE